MKILILGGTGAMGMALVPILANNPLNEIYVTSRSARTSAGNVHYIQGNAHEISFIKKLLDAGDYDAIVDFMIYLPQEFAERVEVFLSATKQYMFLSSGRVYADSGDSRITECSSRLLDVCTDEIYLATNEYALAKAREEDVLRSTPYRNWTIIRPYITYNDNRLQLGVFEKEYWLYRALNHQTIVFSKDIAKKYTTLTYGYDVAKVIAELIGNKKALGQAFNIATDQSIKWGDVLELYLEVIEKELQYRPRVYMLEDSEELSKECRCQYQVSCDRLYNRLFSSEKAERIIGHKIYYTDVRDGLERCLRNHIRACAGQNVKGIESRMAAYLDELTGEHTVLN